MENQKLKILVFLIDLVALNVMSKFVLKTLSLSEAVYLLFFLLILYSLRVYDLDNLKSFKAQLSRTILSSVLLMVIFSFFDLIRIFNFTSEHVWLALSIAVVVAIANTITFYTLKRFIKPQKYIIIGKEEEYSKIAEELANDQNLMFGVSGYVNPDLSQLRALMPMSSGVLIGNLKFAKMIEKEFNANYSNKKIEYLPDFVEQRLKRIPLSLIEKYEQYYILEFSKPKDTLAIRLLDIFVSIVAIILTSPLWLIIALAILIEDGRPVIFKQKRAGKDGKLFTMYKFRSMKNLPQNDSQPKYPDQEKDRILKVGKIIRKYRLDELPQLINVLKGDMSIVGPRPEQKELHEIYSNANIPYYEYRLKVKPGITGWAQIAYQYSSSIDEAAKKLEYDLWYVKNKSFWLNVKIILKTPETMLFKRGAK
ncbi:MAG: exopolysaccharide biosynthesis polyprenyl glycosylphosphotransferase [Fervidobacterium sp.]|uniref:exopolysaccharide biosynthesis polyprenyl glycosylphosphotransferase n=1 Tax=Fervidobacterium sp. TaxID=1871331 RepID=UPI00404B0785